MYIKTDGIVLRETQYKDADKLLTVFSREFGKITLRARGVKSARSRLKAPCQLLAYSEFTIKEYQGRYTIVEAMPKELFSEVQRDLELFYLAAYFVQITETVAQENDPDPELLSLLLNALYALAKLNRPQWLVKAVFELRTACLSGFMPDLRGCVHCDAVFPDRFNISQGVLQCAACGDLGDDIRMPLSPGTLQALRFLCEGRGNLFSFTLSEASAAELNHITESYLILRLERGFSALDDYKKLFL